MNYLILRSIWIALALTTLSACSPTRTAIRQSPPPDGYADFYKSTPQASTILANRAAAPPTYPPIVSVQDINRDLLLTYINLGYEAIGYSSFQGGAEGQWETNAISQGARVSADVVLLMTPKYAGTKTTVVPITKPTVTTSYSTENATALGFGEVINAFGNRTTTTFGETTYMAPVQHERLNYGAVYLVKIKFLLGAHYRSLTTAERQSLKTNKGIYITTVIDGYPAYKSDIIPGDIILAVNNVQVAGDTAAMGQIIKELAGKKANFTIYRQGKKLNKQVQLLQ